MNFTVINVFRQKKKSTEIREKSGNFFFFNERSPWVALMLGCSGWLRIRLAVQVRAEDLQTEYLQTTTIASFARYGWSRSRQVAGGWTTGTKSRVWDSWGGSERLDPFWGPRIPLLTPNALTLPCERREWVLKRVDESWGVWGMPCISRPTGQAGPPESVAQLCLSYSN